MKYTKNVLFKFIQLLFLIYMKLCSSFSYRTFIILLKTLKQVFITIKLQIRQPKIYFLTYKTIKSGKNFFKLEFSKL